MSQYGGPPDPGEYDNPQGQPTQPFASNYPGYGQPAGQQSASPYGAPAYGQQPPIGEPSPVYGQPYGMPVPYGAPPQGTHMDPETGVVIPNGTEVASVGLRIAAFFLYFVLLIVTLVIGYFIWALVEWSNGRTPVQRVLGLRCYKNNEFRVFGWGDMFLRQFVLWACGIIWPVQLANFIVFLVNGKRQGLHDMASNCIVLHDPNKVLG